MQNQGDSKSISQEIEKTLVPTKQRKEKGKAMNEKKQMHLIKRGKNYRNGGTYEIWDADGKWGVYVDFNPSPTDTGVPETMAFSLDIPELEVTDWAELAVWYEDATGGKAIRELGYEPVEDGDTNEERRDIVDNARKLAAQREEEAAESIEWVPIVHSVNGVLQW